MFHGAIWRLSLQTHYERDAAHSGKIVAAKWREIWMELQDMTGCCGGVSDGANNITLINTQIMMLIQVWKQTWIDAAFDIDVAFPETPDLFDSDPGDMGDAIPQRNRALCLAVTSWVDELMNRGVNLAEEAGVTVATGLGAGIVIPFVPAKIVLGGFVAAAFALAELVSQLVDSDYRNYLKCAMFEDLKGKDTNSPSDFAESWDNLPARPPPPQSLPENIARDAIETWGRSQLNNVDNYLGFIQTLNTAMSVSSSLSDDDCQCLAVEIEDVPSFPYTSPSTITHLGGTRWEVIAGVFNNPGPSDGYQIQRVGGGCMSIVNIVKTSGSLARTSWTPCGGAPAFTDNPVPLAKLNVERYSNGDPGQTDGFVVEFDAIVP